jgi:hypothetical protein
MAKVTECRIYPNTMMEVDLDTKSWYWNFSSDTQINAYITVNGQKIFDHIVYLNQPEDKVDIVFNPREEPIYLTCHGIEIVTQDQYSKRVPGTQVQGSELTIAELYL